MAGFLAEEVAAPFAWGRDDCTLFAANWAARLTGRDPAARWRGSYESEAGARCLVAAQGGLPAFGAALGWPPARAPWRAGDVAVVVLRPGPLVPQPLAGARFAVRTGKFWAMKRAPAGVFMAGDRDVRVLAGWRAPGAGD